MLIQAFVEIFSESARKRVLPACNLAHLWGPSTSPVDRLKSPQARVGDGLRRDDHAHWRHLGALRRHPAALDFLQTLQLSLPGSCIGEFAATRPASFSPEKKTGRLVRQKSVRKTIPSSQPAPCWLQPWPRDE